MGVGTLFLGTNSSGGINLSAELIPGEELTSPEELNALYPKSSFEGWWETGSYWSTHLYFVPIC